MYSEATLKAGDVCLDCQQLGLKKHLRYFKINLNGETLLKCESNECMYPYNDELSSSDDEEKTVGNFTETNSLELIDDLIQHYNTEDELENRNNCLQINQSVTEEVTHFDITFLDGLHVMNENLCKAEITVKNDECLVDEFNVVENKYSSLPTFGSAEYEMSSVIAKESNNEPNDNKLSGSNLTGDTLKDFPMEYKVSYDNKLSALNVTISNIQDCKKKIDIQSIETIKFETPLYNDLPSSSKPFTTPNDILLTNNNNVADTAIKTKSKPNRTLNSPKSKSVDIPKAVIIKGNALLKKLAMMDTKEKSPTFITSKNRIKKNTSNGNIIKHDEPGSSFSGSSDYNDYSVDKLSEMFLSKKNKI